MDVPPRWEGDGEGSVEFTITDRIPGGDQAQARRRSARRRRAAVVVGGTVALVVMAGAAVALVLADRGRAVGGGDRLTYRAPEAPVQAPTPVAVRVDPAPAPAPSAVAAPPPEPATAAPRGGPAAPGADAGLAEQQRREAERRAAAQREAETRRAEARRDEQRREEQRREAERRDGARRAAEEARRQEAERAEAERLAAVRAQRARVVAAAEAPAAPARVESGTKLAEADRDGPAGTAAVAEPPRKAGLDPSEIQVVVARSRGEFDACMREARDDPEEKALLGKHVGLVITVLPNGHVTKPTVDDAAVDGATLGYCLKKVGLRMTFPTFQGEKLQVRLPLKLGVAD